MSESERGKTAFERREEGLWERAISGWAAYACPVDLTPLSPYSREEASVGFCITCERKFVLRQVTTMVLEEKKTRKKK